MNHELRRPEDDQDLRELFEHTSPAEMPVDIDELIGHSESRKLDESAVRSDPLPNVWSELMTRRNGLTAVGIAACALIAIIIGIVESRSGYAFADVKEEVEATKSVRYTETRTDGRHDETARHADMVVIELEHRLKSIEEELESAEGDEKEQLLGEQQRSEEMLDRTLRRIQIQGDEPWETHVMILGRYRQRVERPNVLGDHVSITNMETGESIVVNHEEQSVQRLTRQITIDEETGERNEYEITGNTSVDFYGMLRNLPDDAVELPDRKFVDGVELIGFQSVEQVGADTWTRTVWVDPETRLPRESHTQYRSSNPRHGDSDWFFSNIEFDVPLDESLFSTEPPAGYTVTDSSIMGIIPSD